MTIDEQIAILQAVKNGKQIECRPQTSLLDEWFTWALYQFDFTNYDYRIKKEPRELWAAINRYGVIDYWATDKQTLVDLTDKDPRSWEIVKFSEVIE